MCTVYPSMYVYTHIDKFQMDHDIGLTMLAYACRSVIIESYYCITYSIWMHVRKIVRIVCGVCFVINVCMSVSHLFHQAASCHQSPPLPPSTCQTSLTALCLFQGLLQDLSVSYCCATTWASTMRCSSITATTIFGLCMRPQRLSSRP